jgi:hypothetical protein
MDENENGPTETPVIFGESDSSQGQVQPQDTIDTDTQENSGGNPAWQEFLEVLPTQLHSQVTPVLEKWDRGVQERFQKIHEEYEPYKAYDPFKEAGVDPETIDYALNIMQALNDDPRKMWEAMAEYYKFADEAQAQDSDDDDEYSFDGDVKDPRVDRLEQGVEVMANMLLQKQEAEQQAQQDAELENEIATLKDKHGDFDEGYVLTYAINNEVDLESAISAYQDLERQIAQKIQAPAAPSVIGAGGGTVGVNRPDPAKMSPAERKALAVQMLQAAAQQT